VTRLLAALTDGDQAALGRLLPLVYEELHGLAQRALRRERQGHTLQATALVNEAYMRLIDIRQVRCQNRAHFFAMSRLRTEGPLIQRWLPMTSAAMITALGCVIAVRGLIAAGILQIHV